MYGLLVVCMVAWIWDMRFLSYIFVTGLCDYYLSSSPLVSKWLNHGFGNKKCKGHLDNAKTVTSFCTSIYIYI